MHKLSSVKSATPLSQVERLARKDELDHELARLNAEIRAVEDELADLLTRCEHTYPDGRSSVVGGATKVCAHCGKTVSRRGEKLWQ
jgi:hypothetical protein